MCPGHDDVAAGGHGSPQEIASGPVALVVTPNNELSGRLSSDGRWLAYYSDLSGRDEVYVQPFPNIDDGKWLISTDGGHSPVWAPSGRELFYARGTELIAVPIEVGSDNAIIAATPQTLFDGPFDTTQDHNFDVFPDGNRFVMIQADPDARPTRLRLVLNWFEELKPRLPGER